MLPGKLSCLPYLIIAQIRKREAWCEIVRGLDFPLRGIGGEVDRNDINTILMKSSEEVVVLLEAAHSRRMSLLVGVAADRVTLFFSLFT
jgi:hypothetical protein